MTFEEIQSQWKSQPALEIPTDSSQLQVVQEQQRKLQSTIFWRDFREVGVAFAMAAVMIPVGLRRMDWELLLMGACVTFVGVFMLVDRWRQRRRRPAHDGTLRACAEASLAEVEHQIWLLRNIFWWYLLPCLIGGLGITLPVALRDWNTLPAARHIMTPIAVAVCLFFGAVCWGGYRLNQVAVRDSLEPRRRELLSILEQMEIPTTGI